MGDKVLPFETNDTIVSYYPDLGFNDINFQYAYGEESVYFMLHQKNIPIQEYKISTEKSKYQYLYKKTENGNESLFIKCINISDKNSK